MGVLDKKGSSSGSSKWEERSEQKIIRQTSVQHMSAPDLARYQAND